MELCTICEKNPCWTPGEDTDLDYCMACWFTGRYFESVLASEEREYLLVRIREIENVTSADVYHFGSGAFNLLISLADGRIIAPGMPAEMLGNPIVVPMIPPAGTKWAVAVTRTDADRSQWGEQPTVMPDLVDDDELVKLIEEIS